MTSLAQTAIFDLAVNRAARFVDGAGKTASLEDWHAKTRFASRVELTLIRSALGQRPPEGEWHWVGGESGRWQTGKPQTP